MAVMTTSPPSDASIRIGRAAGWSVISIDPSGVRAPGVAAQGAGGRAGQPFVDVGEDGGASRDATGRAPPADVADGPDRDRQRVASPLEIGVGTRRYPLAEVRGRDHD